jgi:hypothetical protein
VADGEGAVQTDARCPPEVRESRRTKVSIAEDVAFGSVTGGRLPWEQHRPPYLPLGT